MKILITYGTTDGQTAKICHFIHDELKQAGYSSDLAEAKNVCIMDDYDFYIIAASVHIGGYQKSIKKLVKKHSELLNENPSAFLSVSLTAAGNNSKAYADLENITKNFLEKTSWTPLYTLQVAGALQYSKYNFIIKYVMREIARKNGGDTDTSQDYEYTDWKQIRDFTKAFIKDQAYAF